MGPNVYVEKQLYYLVWVLSIPTSDLQNRKLKPNVSDETLREIVDIWP